MSEKAANNAIKQVNNQSRRDQGSRSDIAIEQP
jgi:hypothetical protein